MVMSVILTDLCVGFNTCLFIYSKKKAKLKDIEKKIAL